jgi:AraC-like DNA-binding protein/quercetin dioxygenase-like cupin family protein
MSKTPDAIVKQESPFNSLEREAVVFEVDPHMAVFRVHRVLQEPHYVRSGRHHHPFYEVLYYLEGGATTFIQGRVYSVRAGDLVLIAPHHVHSTVYSGETTVARIGLWFNDAYLGRAIHRVLDAAGVLQGFAGNTRVIHSEGNMREQLLGLLEQLLAESERVGQDARIMCHSLLVTFLVTVHRTAQSSANRESTDIGGSQSVVGAVAEYISEHYAEEITLPLLAGKFGTTPTSLARAFKRDTQCTVIEYLQYVRVTAAARLLRGPEFRDVQIHEVAVRVGFNNLRHFGRVFQKIIGASPRTYRAQRLSSATAPPQRKS